MGRDNALPSITGYWGYSEGGYDNICNCKRGYFNFALNRWGGCSDYISLHGSHEMYDNGVHTGKCEHYTDDVSAIDIASCPSSQNKLTEQDERQWAQNASYL